jgi:hypothetical protein
LSSSITYYYRVRAVDACGQASGVAAYQTVLTTGSVGGTANATPAIICQGSTTALSLTGYSGTIQWYSSPDNATWTIIAGATTTPYTTAAINANTYYRAVVTVGACPSSNSTSKLVTINTPPVGGTATPVPASVCSGGTSVITLTGNTGTIQWQTSLDNITWVNITGATTSPYTTPALYFTTYYRAAVSSGVCPIAYSSVATVTDLLTIALDPVNACVAAGGNTSFHVTATGAPAYQWQVSTNGGGSWSNLSNGGVYSNVTTATMNITGAVVGMNGYLYKCICTNGCTAISNAATLTVGGTTAAPTVNAASGLGQFGFTANWNASAGASGYYIDIAYDNAFISFVSGYQNLNVGNVVSYAVTGLACGTTYYYRISSYSGCTTNAYSLVKTITTTACSNNSCATAYSFGVPGGTCSSPWFNTSGSAGSGIASFYGCPSVKDIWFSFVCPASGSVTIDGIGSVPFNPVVELMRGCPTATLVTGLNNGTINETESIYATGLMPDSTYYVRIYGCDAPGVCSICITSGATAATTNDLPSGAIALTNHDCYPQDTRSWVFYSPDGTGNAGEPATPACWSSSSGNTMWFSFVAITSAQLVTTDWHCSFIARGAADNRIDVYRSSNNLSTGAFTLIGCEDDASNSMTYFSTKISAFDNPYADICSYSSYCANRFEDYQTALTVTGLTVGNTYFVRVDAASGSGLVSICTQPAPANDACATAQAVVKNMVYNVNTNGGSPFSNNNVSDLGFSTGTTQNMIYYTFTPLITDLYYINQWNQFCELSIGTQFLVYNAGENCASITQAINGSNVATEFINSGASTTANRALSGIFIGGQTYYILYDGGAGDEATFNWEITEATPMPLPIELLDFRALCDKAVVKAKWTTASETNNDYFILERSADGIHFTEAAKVKGAGNSSTPNYYSANDFAPETGTSYYRLKQVDFNGQFTYSKTVAVFCKVKGLEVTAIIPVPSDNYVDIYYYIDKDDNMLFQLYDAIGRQVIRETDQAHEGGNIHRIDLTSISSGVYFVTVKSSDDIYTAKIIKK